MSGLLDKANAAKGTEEAAKEPVVVSATAKDTPSHKTSNVSSPAGSPDTATKINLAGWVIVLLGAILSLQGGAWALPLSQWSLLLELVRLFKPTECEEASTNQSSTAALSLLY
jgi:hypothetical protein